MGYASRQGRARISPSGPQAAGVCDRCGFVYNHIDLQWQFDWRGATLQNTRVLVCDRCNDDQQQQLRAIVIPADPVPIMNPRVQDFVAASTTRRTTSGQDTVNFWTGIPIPGDDTRITQDDRTRVPQQTGAPPGSLNQQPGTDPNAPGNDDPGLPYENTDVPETGPLT